MTVQLKKNIAVNLVYQLFCALLIGGTSYAAEILPTQSVESRFEELQSKYSQEPKQEIQFEGFRFSGTKLEVEALPKILSGKLPSNWKAQAANCKTALCALTVGFESESAAKLALIVYEYSGYTVSLNQEFNEIESRFTLSDISEIDSALQKLPPHFYHLKSLQQFVKKKQGCTNSDPLEECSAVGKATPPMKTYDGSENTIPGRIYLYWGYSTATFWEQTVLHEIGHHVDYRINWDDNSIKSGRFAWSSRPDFLSCCWIPDKKVISSAWELRRGPGHRFVSDYATRNPAEDFAETFAKFALDPKALRITNPDRFKLMKKLFQLPIPSGINDSLQEQQRAARESDSQDKRLPVLTSSFDSLPTQAGRVATQAAK